MTIRKIGKKRAKVSSRRKTTKVSSRKRNPDDIINTYNEMADKLQELADSKESVFIVFETKKEDKFSKFKERMGFNMKGSISQISKNEWQVTSQSTNIKFDLGFVDNISINNSILLKPLITLYI